MSCGAGVPGSALLQLPRRHVLVVAAHEALLLNGAGGVCSEKEESCPLATLLCITTAHAVPFCFLGSAEWG